MRILWTLLLGLLALPAWAGVVVETASGKVVVRVNAARVAAWQPRDNEIVILADGAGDAEILGLPARWQGDFVYQDGMHGVYLRGAALGWTALQQDGAWLIREGKPQQKDVGALMLKDGWRVNGVAVPRKQVEVAGSVWQVGTVDRPVKVGGSVVGLVKKGAMTLAEKKAEEAVERVSSVPKPKAGGMRVVSVEQMLARIEPAAGAAPRQVVAAPSGMVKKQGVKGERGAAGVASAGGSKVVTYGADTVAAVDSPVVKSEGVREVGGMGDVYVPGTVVSVTVPQEILKAVEPSVSVAPPLAHEEDGEGVLVEALFPPREGQYADGLARAMGEVIGAPAKDAEVEARRRLAAFYLAWQRPEEVLAMAPTLPRRADGLPEDTLARMYVGIARVALGRAAGEGVFDQKGALAGHAQLWRAVAASKAGDYAVALKEWPKRRGILPLYPAYLREAAQVAQATALAMVGDADLAVKVVEELANQYETEKVPAALLRLHGILSLQAGNAVQGINDLAKAAENKDDPATAYRAKFEFLQALAKRDEVSDKQMKTYLEQLWLDWRGDHLERDILGALADLYEKTGEPREALQHWQTLVRAYPDVPDLNAVTERMTEAFVDVFDPENPISYDPLTYMGLYYDFGELVPNDGRGDAIREQVAHLLSDATLWRRAQPILEQQLAYRPLDDAAKVRVALLLAEVYRREGRAGDSLKLLDRWEKLASGDVVRRSWALAQAQALFDLGRYAAVVKSLAPMKNDREALRLMVEADLKQGNWKGVVAHLEGGLKGITPENVVKDTGYQLDVFQLAYAYGQLRDGEGLRALEEHYSAALAKLPELADGVNAVASGTGIASTTGEGSMAGLTNALADMNTLTDRLGALRKELSRTRERREEYNNKMRYMELLPPPVI